MDVQTYISLLQQLIRIYSPSGSEHETADVITDFLSDQNIPTQRVNNNVIAFNKHYNKDLPNVVINSHHDTVEIGNGWTRDPLGGEIVDSKLYGRGSNDAGASLVSFIAAFCHLFEEDLSYNLILIASGEEENFGPNGVSRVLKEKNLQPQLAIIGEPTSLELAVAEKGLIVIDAKTIGKAGHAARDVGINALYLAIEDIQKIVELEWSKVSPVLGKVKTTVTQISSGSQHNVIPDECSYVIDCRINELYRLEEVLDNLNLHTHANLSPRTLKWRSSGIALDHPLVTHAQSLGISIFGSPTLSDQVHFTCPSVKIGPGQSERSHTADEYIELNELSDGINKYIALLQGLKLDRS